MKLVCHIGTPKTASTFLQNTCFANPLWLRERGILYPDLLTPTPNHITLFYANADTVHDFARDYGLSSQKDVKKFRSKLSDTIGRQIEQAPKDTHTMLMSSENLTGNLRTPTGIARLKEFLAPHFDEISILVYTRRQDDAILSMYGEFMRRGFSDRTFDQFLKKALSPQSQVPYLYYRLELLKWIEVFGQDAVTVRIFDRSSLLGGDVLTDFMAQVLAPGSDLDVSGMRPSSNDNVGLSAPVLEFLRLMYPSISFRNDGTMNPLRGYLGPLINQLPAEPRPQMSVVHARAIMAKFRPANVWLKDTFFPDHKGPLFPMKARAGQQGNLGDITLDEFAGLSGKLLTLAAK